MPRQSGPLPDRGGAPVDPEPDPGIPGGGSPPTDSEPDPGAPDRPPPGDRPDDQGGAPVDPEPAPGVPDSPPLTDEPDIAVQVYTCLDRLDLFDPGDRDEDELSPGEQVRVDIRTDMRRVHPRADVRFACIDGTERIGMWREPVAAEDEHAGVRHQRRDEALAAIALLGDEEHLAYRVRTDFVKAQAREQWKRLPKRYGTSGKPKEGGPVRLRYVRIGFPERRLVRTTVGVQWRKVKLRIHVEDRLSLGHGRHRLPLCDSEVKIRPRAVKWGIGLTKGVMWLLFPRKGRPDVKSGAEGQGAGCAILAELPEQFLIRGHELKMEVSYQRLEVSRKHLAAGATLRTTGRRPQVRIEGPSQVPAMTPQAVFTAHTRDLRGDPEIQWTGGGNIASPRSARTSIAFVGEPRGSTQQVQASARDADGVSANATHSVDLVAESDPDRGGQRPGRPTEPLRRPLARRVRA